MNSGAKVRRMNIGQAPLPLPERKFDKTFRNQRLRHFMKFHSRLLAHSSCFHRLDRT